MTKTFTILIFLLTLALHSYQSGAQGARSPIEEVVYAFRNNKPHDVARYFDDYIPVSINNNASNYSHNQAEVILKDFFEKNPIRDFTVMDSGSPSSTSKSMIATFSSNNGRYTLYLLMKLKDNNYVIKEIRLSKE